MPSKSYYKSKDVLEISRIVEVFETCEEAGHIFAKMNCPTVIFETKPTRLPVFDFSHNGRLSRPSVTGSLDMKNNPYSDFKEILQAAKKRSFGHYCCVDVQIHYESLECKQSKRDCDSIGKFIDDNAKLLFKYSDSTVHKINEKGYYRKVFERLITAGELPLVIEDIGGHHRLSHREEGELGINGAFRTSRAQGLNPDYIECELVNESVDSALNRLETVLSKMSSGKIFSYEWKVFYRYHDNGPATSADLLGNELYNLVAAKGLPAKNYYFNSGLELISMQGLEFIQQICGPKDHVGVDIFACRHPQNSAGYLKVGVYITSAGFQFIVEASDPIETTELS